MMSTEIDLHLQTERTVTVLNWWFPTALRAHFLHPAAHHAYLPPVPAYTAPFCVANAPVLLFSIICNLEKPHIILPYVQFSYIAASLSILSIYQPF